jgi:hypothetical protein
MIPMRTSSIFKSRWMALVWAAGIIWVAYDFAESVPQTGGNSAENVAQPTDATGASITPEDQRQVEEALRNL